MRTFGDLVHSVVQRRRRLGRSGMFAMSAVVLIGACDPGPGCAPAPDAQQSAGAPAAATPDAAPAGAVFSEDFTTAAGADRFDWQLHASANGGPCGTVSQDCAPIMATDHAEHNMACEGPTTFRSLPAVTPADFAVIDPGSTSNIYYCAPGNDAAKGHMMTTIDTTGVAVLSFSPKQTFTNVRKVCFDINTNNNIGAGKWVNAWIVPVGSVAANGGRFDFADEPALDIDQQAPGPDDFHFKYMDGSLVGPNDFIWWEWNRRASESATRFTQCVEQTAPGQLTYTRDLPVDANGDGVVDPGVAETVTRTGAGDIPRGAVRVIFQDGSYNPEKHGSVTGAITWHWDNINIS